MFYTVCVSPCVQSDNQVWSSVSSDGVHWSRRTLRCYRSHIFGILEGLLRTTSERYSGTHGFCEWESTESLQVPSPNPGRCILPPPQLPLRYSSCCLLSPLSPATTPATPSSPIPFPHHKATKSSSLTQPSPLWRSGTMISYAFLSHSSNIFRLPVNLRAD